MNNFEIVEFLDYVTFETEGSFSLNCEIHGSRISSCGASLLGGGGLCRPNHSLKLGPLIENLIPTKKW